jgi:hypothetical protein
MSGRLRRGPCWGDGGVRIWIMEMEERVKALSDALDEIPPDVVDSDMASSSYEIAVIKRLSKHHP